MAFHNANFEAITLSGTQQQGDLGNGVTASTVHRIYCLSAGNIDITPMKGPTFNWVAIANEFIDILVSRTKVNAGSFVGFKAQFQAHQFYATNYNA